MSKRKVLLIAGVLVAGGAAIAYAASGYRGGHGMMGGGVFEEWLHGGEGAGQGPGGWKGRLGKSITRETFDGKVREVFARFDTNSDGAVDAAEIEAGLAKQRGRGWGRKGRGPGGESGADGPGAMAGRMLGFLDADRDGKVTKDEFLAEVRRRFALMDLDGDGRITDADLPPMMRGRGLLAGDATPAMGRGPMGAGGRMLSMLRGTDANKDGAITLDEAVAAGEARFVRMDRTKDGSLDKADGDALRKEMTDYRVKRVLHRFGAAKDGKITRDQAFKIAGEMFTRLDRNGDGTLSREERPFGGMRGHRGHGREGGGRN